MSVKSSVVEANPRARTDLSRRRQIDHKETLEALAKLARTPPRPLPQPNPPRTSRTLIGVVILGVVAGAAIPGWRHFRSPHPPAAASPALASVIVADASPATTSVQSPPLPAAPAVARDKIEPAAPPVPAPDRQQFEAMAREIAALRQTVEQFEAATRELADLRQTVERLTATQDQAARDVAKLAPAGPETGRNAPTPGPRTAAAPVRERPEAEKHKPAPASPPPASSDSSSDLLKRVLAPFQSK